MAEKTSELNDHTYANTEKKDEKMIAVMSDASDEARIDTSLTENEDTSAEAERIKARIEGTRREMGETIDAIQERLSFNNISEQVKGEVTEKINDVWETAKYTTIRKVGEIMGYVNQGIEELGDTQAGRVARNNPVAISLIGLGVGMLLVNLYRKDSSREYEYSRRNIAAGDSTYADARDKVGSAAGSAYETASSTAGSAYGAVTGAASGAYNKASDAAGYAYQSVGNVAGKAYDQVGNLGSSVKDVAGKAYDQYDYYIEENPLAVGAVALAVGAAVGLSIPATRYESRLMGETRDRLMQQASNQIGELVKNAGEIAQDKYDGVKKVAEQTVDKAVATAKDEAKNQDLM